jgi:signal transduction histidine kinase/CheY-like chemotaxis protein/ABC-type phosphate/phosphonate transport system substrate-binding protein
MRLPAPFCHILLCIFLFFCTSTAFAKDVLKLGVLAYEDKDSVAAQYAQVVNALNERLTSVEIQMEVLSQQELNSRVEDGSIDIVITNPVHYLLLRHRYGLSRLLATQVKAIGESATPLLGGVIFTREDRQDINNLQDFMARTIACPGRYFLGGFALQAHEFMHAGIRITDWAKTILEFSDHDEVVQAVLKGQADVGFVRTGVLEALFQNGLLRPQDIKVINARQYRGFPFLVSTELYPEWPVAAMPHVNEGLCRTLTATLLGVQFSNLSSNTSYIAGYTLPLSYDAVEEIMLELKFPGFNALEIFWNDILRLNKWHGYLMLGGLLLICCLVLLLGLALLNATEEKRRMQAMLNGMPYPGLLVNREHRIIAVNAAARELFNAREGAYCWEQLWHCEFLPEDQRKHYECHGPTSNMCCSFCRSEDALNTGKTVHTELFIQGRYWDSWWVPIDSSIFLHYFVDITEHKNKEKQLKEAHNFLRTVADTVQDMIWVKDLQGQYLFTNKAHNDILFRLPDQNELLGHDHRFFAERIRAERPNDNGWYSLDQTCKDSDAIVISTGKPYRSKESGIVFGKYLCLDVIKVPMFDENGRLIAVAGSARDITEDERLKKEHEELQKRLQQSAKMEAIGIMAGGIAHNFNNLLQVITGYAQLLAQRIPAKDEVARRGLNQIGQSCEKAATLVRSLMAFSRKTEYVSMELNLNNEVLNVQKVLKDTLPKAITLETDLEQRLWTVKADSIQIQTVLFNLVNNARDAMPEGGVLRIATRNVSLSGRPEGQEETSAVTAGTSSLAAGDYVLLEVSDTGCGMTEETLQHLFEPFFTTKGINKGTGLGLSSSYGIVKAYGGEIFCNSTLGKGTRFEIYLPAVSRESLPMNGNQSSMEPVLLTPQTKGKTILLVDDEEGIRSLARQALESAGHRVLEAESGEKALEIYKTSAKEIHLVILDLNMPGMSGHVCLQRLLEMDMNARVLVASGYSDKGMEQTVLSQGAAGFLAKPFKLDILLKKVDEIAAD